VELQTKREEREKGRQWLFIGRLFLDFNSMPIVHINIDMVKTESMLFKLNSGEYCYQELRIVLNEPF
jgi:hypothetical protein